MDAGVDVLGGAANVLTVRGAEGWEAVGTTFVDKLGINAVYYLLKRRIVPPPAPEKTEAGWYPDPCGRWQVRYWDGACWSAHVARETGKPGGEKGVDPPQTLPAISS